MAEARPEMRALADFEPDDDGGAEVAAEVA